MQIGFIGTGTMGTMLIDAFIGSGAVQPSQIIANNRTSSKVLQLAEKHAGLTAAESCRETILASDIIFLCVKPHEFRHVITEIKSFVRPYQMIVSITSPVQIAHLEGELPCKIAKVIPSITNQMNSGATLCMYGSAVPVEDREELEGLLSHISKPLQIEERYTRIVSDLSSCGPAFVAFLLDQFAEAAVLETHIDRRLAEQVISSMLLGTGLLLTEGGLSLQDLQRRVAVPGGITAKALQMLQRDTDGMFEQLIRTTHAKYEQDLALLNEEFCNEEVNES